MAHFNLFYFTTFIHETTDMQKEQHDKVQKKIALSRRKTTEPAEFQSEITIVFDQFYRYFNYNYPGKNKEDIINKCLTGNIYWILLDSIYYPDNIDLETQRIAIFRKKSILKNGSFPPTKDNLEEEKFILYVRKMISEKVNTLNLEEIRNHGIQQVIQSLQTSLERHQLDLTKRLQDLTVEMHADNKRYRQKLQNLGIPIIKAAKLFAYELLQKQVIKNSIEKAELKEKEPRCDFCFIRDKEIIKCRTCDLYTHANCFPRAQIQQHDFICDACLFEIPTHAKCQLCPIQNGNFLQLSFDSPLFNYNSHRGQTNLKLKIMKQKHQFLKQRRFVHVSCYVMRQQQCTYNVITSKVDGIHLVDRNRKNPNLCSICGNMVGITVSCNNESCRRSFHPQCAKRNNLNINVIKATKALLEIYCERHKKQQPYEYLRDSLSNRIKQLRKFYQNLDYELKKYGVNHNVGKSKKINKLQQLLKQDRCLHCEKENDYKNKISNCRRCYGWHHEACCKHCPYCD